MIPFDDPQWWPGQSTGMPRKIAHLGFASSVASHPYFQMVLPPMATMQSTGDLEYFSRWNFVSVQRHGLCQVRDIERDAFERAVGDEF